MVECDTLRPSDLGWALERQAGLRELRLRDVPGLLRPGGQPALGRPGLAVLLEAAPAEHERLLRRSRRAAGGGPWLAGQGPEAAEVAGLGGMSLAG